MKILTIKSFATAALATLALALVPASLHAREITVPSGSYLTIQDGVDAAAPGDTVIVLPGTYVINYAEGSSWPPGVYIGPHKPGLKLRAGGASGSVKIVGVGTIGTGYPILCGILVRADNALVEGFDISGFPTGISIQSSPVATQIAHNTIYRCVLGIFLNGSSAAGPNWQAHIHHNQVNNQLNDTLWAWAGASGTGIFLWQAPGCQIDHNECDNNGTTGISLANSPNCTVAQNVADNNGQAGIGIGGSTDGTVSYNEADNNGSWGIIVGSSCGTHFEHNSAEGNGWAAPEGHPSWDFYGDLFAPNWGSDPACNTYLDNHAGTASPSLTLWDVK